MTTRIQVVFYSMYGHIDRMAEAVAEGAREVSGAEVTLYQVPELVPDDVLVKSGAKKAREAFARVPVIKPEQLADADAIIFGTGTPYGASTLTGADGSRLPSENELAIARYQGRHVATIASALKRGRL